MKPESKIFDSLFKKIRSLSLSLKIKLSIKDYSTVQGWLTPGEAFCLYHYATKLSKNAVIVEIGSWKGRSTYCLAKGLKSGKVFAIDPFVIAGDIESQKSYSTAKGNESILSQFLGNIRRLNVSEKTIPLVGYSKDFINDFNTIDLLFIDGDHSVEGCLFDYQNYSNKIPKDGFLLIHDYDPKRKDLGPTYLLKNHIIPSGIFEEIKIIDSLWVGKKR